LLPSFGSRDLEASVHKALPVSRLTHALATLLLAWLVATPRLQAQSIVLRRPALHWVRSDEALGCVDPRTLAEHVELLVGPVLVRPSEAEHSIEGRVELSGSGLVHVRVRVLDALGNKVGEREFAEAVEQCDKLTPAIVFVIGMAIDPEVAAHGLPPSLLALLGGSDGPAEQALLEELDQLPGGEPQPPPAPIKHKVVPLPPLPPPRWQAAALARAALAETPRLLLSGEARLLHDLSGRFAAGGYLRGGAQVGEHKLAAGQTARVSALDVGALGCLVAPSQHVLRLSGCLGAELSLRIGTGHGFDDDWRTTEVGVGLVAQLGARLRLSRTWGLAVVVGGRLELGKPAFTYDDPLARHPAYTFPRLAGALAVGPSYEF
jgi:hypothetical protein